MHPLLARVPRIQMIAVFECAARLGSFTEAAKELGMTQPGVSRHISALERTTGLSLFDRTANKVALNSTGEALYSAVQTGFDTISSTVERLRSPSQTFLLAANPGFAQQWLIPYLEELQAVLGEADLRLHLFDRDSELSSQTFDAAIHLTSTANAFRSSRILFEESVVPVASPAFTLASGLDRESSAAALVDVMKLHLDGRDRQWMAWPDWFEANGVSWSPGPRSLSYNNYPLVINDAVAGRGVALAWRGLIEGMVDAGALVIVGPEVQRHDRAYQLIAGPSSSPDMIERVAEWLVTLTRGEG